MCSVFYFLFSVVIAVIQLVKREYRTEGTEEQYQTWEKSVSVYVLWDFGIGALENVKQTIASMTTTNLNTWFPFHTYTSKWRIFLYDKWKWMGKKWLWTICWSRPHRHTYTHTHELMHTLSCRVHPIALFPVHFYTLKIVVMANCARNISLLSHTISAHMKKNSVPWTIGKELYNFFIRIKRQLFFPNFKCMQRENAFEQTISSMYLNIKEPYGWCCNIIYVYHLFLQIVCLHYT